MSGTNTNGFDVIVRLTEKAINDGLKMLPGPTGTPPGAFPLTELQQVNLPVPVPTALGSTNVNVPYDVTLELERPQIRLQSNPAGVSVICNFGPSSELTLVPPVPAAANPVALLSQVPLHGSIQFDCAIPAPPGVALTTTPWPGGPVSGQAVLALLTPPAQVVTTFNIPAPLNVGTVIAGGAAVNVPVMALQNALSGAFTDFPSQINDLPLTTPIPLHTGTNPTQRLQDLQAAIMTPPAGTTDRPALALGLLSEQSNTAQSQGQGLGPENIAGVTQPAGLVGGAVDVANFWLVELVCRTIQQSPGFQGVSFTITSTPPAGNFTGSVQINPPSGNAFTLTSMSVTVNPGIPGGIDIGGSGSMGGFCWSATFSFMGTMTFTCDAVNGVVASLSSPLIVTPNVSIPWYCWLVAGVIVGLIVGALTNWIVGLIVGVIVAIIVANINPGLPNLPSISNIPGLFTGPGLPLPFPVGSPGLIVSSCQFDDLAVQGTPLYIDLAPRLSSGDALAFPGTAFDLDTATVSTIGGSIPTNVDLIWTGSSIDSENGCRMEVANVSFETLTLTDLEQMSFGLTSISASQIPLFILPWWWLPGLPLSPIFLGPPLVIGARTTEGLYAKCAVWRELNGTRLYIQFETYVGTAVSFSLDVLIETTDIDIVKQYEEDCYSSEAQPVPNGACHCPGIEIIRIHDEVFILQVKRSQRIKVHALPQVLVAPISYAWTVLGVPLGSGHGSTVIQNVKVKYDSTSPFLELTAPMGVDIIGQICVLATDADGRKCQACVSVYRPGTITEGGCRTCEPPALLPEYQRQIKKLSRLTETTTAAEKRLRMLTASVKVPAERAVPVPEALEELISRK